MDHRVTGYVISARFLLIKPLMIELTHRFPFNVLDNPMYVGTTLSFLATALWLEKPAGILITIYIWIVYIVALRYEE